MGLALACRSRLLVVLASFTVCVPALALGEESQTPGSSLPATPAGRAAKMLFTALEAGHAEREMLVRSEFSARALEDTPADEWVRFLDRLAEQSGGFEIQSIAPDSTPTFLVMDVRAKKVDRFGRLLVAVARRREPGKIADVMLLRGRDPAKVASDAWPARKLASEEEIVAEIDRRLRRLAEEDFLSGVVLVAKGESVVYHEAFGLANQGTRTPNRLDTRFNLGSMDKMFTGVAIGQLVEQKRLSLDDTVAELLPDFPNREVAERITVEQVLTHSSGLGDFFGPRYRAARLSLRTHRDYFPLIASDSLAFEPGARFGYSNSGYALLGAIVEAVSGEDYFDYVRTHVFAPAGMTDTGSPALDEEIPNRATGYFHPLSDPLGLEPRVSNENAIAFKGNGAGGGYATALDLFRFSRALLAHRLLSPETTAAVLAPRIDITGFPRPNAKYGFGFIREECGGRGLVGNGGGGAYSGVSSDLHLFADGRWTVVVLTNYDPPSNDLAWELCLFLARQ